MFEGSYAIPGNYISCNWMLSLIMPMTNCNQINISNSIIGMNLLHVHRTIHVIAILNPFKYYYYIVFYNCLPHFIGQIMKNLLK